MGRPSFPEAPLNFLVWHEWSIAGFFFVLLGIAFLNIWGFPRLPRARPKRTPKISVLIPVRDEARNIEECLASLLRQDYTSYEILVYEDGSQDGTKEILSSFGDPRVRVIFGDSPPPGWLGKPWACAQLAKRSTGELLLFLDADVRLATEALSSAVASLERENLDLLSLLPRQKMPTFGTALHVALIPWSLSSFFPLFVRRLRRVAVGQFILVRREAYEMIGGHEAVRTEALEDQALAARAAAAGLRIKLAFAGNLALCRMYQGFRDASRGLAKNLFPLFKKKLLPFTFVWSWLVYVAWQPIFILSLSLAGKISVELARPAAWALGGVFALWTFTAVRFRLPFWLPLAFPLVHLVAFLTAVRSAFWHLSRRGTWKGRSIHVKGGTG